MGITVFFFFFFFFFFFCLSEASSPPYGSYSAQQRPLSSSNLISGPSIADTVPAFPLVLVDNQTCHLDLSDELFGGVRQACGRTNIDRSRCCPVLAAWLFAAHARSALEIHPATTFQLDSDVMPMIPDDSQKCVDSLQTSLSSRDIFLPRPNSSCDAVLCFCGIRLHEMSSLHCPAVFNISVAHRNATPTSAVRDLENNCRNSSYSGCSRCLHSLDKLKGGMNDSGSSNGSSSSIHDHGHGGGDRISRLFGRDCQLLGLTWLLAKNKTAYIPTVSAVLRAIMYSVHSSSDEMMMHHRCSPDHENMPLAVDSLQLEKMNDASSSTQVYVGFMFSVLAAMSLPFLGLLV